MCTNIRIYSNGLWLFSECGCCLTASPSRVFLLPSYHFIIASSSLPFLSPLALFFFLPLLLLPVASLLSWSLA